MTLTLPEDIITVLASVDEDVSRAVVQLCQPLITDVMPRPPAELAKYGNSAVIVVKPVSALKEISGVTLVPLPDGRALISLDETMSVYEFELKLRDALAAAGRDDARESAVLASIAEILKSARRSKGIALHQRRIIVLQSTRRGRATSS